MKVALITGGCSGIGLAIAKELAKRNYNLLLVSNQQESLEKQQTLIEQQFNVSCLFFCTDLSLPAAAKTVYNFCQSQQLEIEILVNNAGILLYSEFINTPVEKAEQIINLHIHTPTLLCRLFSPEMVKRKHGYILNVSSISATMPYPVISLYGPGKAYLRNFTRALWHELLPLGVKVSCLLPGATSTALYNPGESNIQLAMKLGLMQSPEYVARKSVKALFNHKAECVPGIVNKCTMILVKIVPHWVIQWVYLRYGRK